MAEVKGTRSQWLTINLGGQRPSKQQREMLSHMLRELAKGAGVDDFVIHERGPLTAEEAAKCGAPAGVMLYGWESTR